MLMVFGAVCSSFAGTHKDTHGHDWDLIVDGNKASVKCVDSHDCDYHDAYEIILDAPNVTYSGNVYDKATTTNKNGGTVDENYGATIRLGDYKYKGINGTRYTSSTTAPEDAGDYVVERTVSIAYTYDTGSTSSTDEMQTVILQKEFSILKQPIKVKAVDKNIIYGQRPSQVADKILYSTDGGTTYSEEVPAGGVSGTAEFTYTYSQYGDANYEYAYKESQEDTVEYKRINEVTYKIKVEKNLSSDNYDIEYVDGELRVFPKPVAIEWTDTHNGVEAKIATESGTTYVEQKTRYVYDGIDHEVKPEVVNYEQNDGSTKPISLTTDGKVTYKDANAAQTEEELQQRYTSTVKELSGNPNYTLRKEPTIPTVEGEDPEYVPSAQLWWWIDQLTAELEWHPVYRYNDKWNPSEYINDNEVVYNTRNWTAVATVKNAKDESVEVVEYTYGQTAKYPKNASSTLYSLTAVKLNNDNYKLPNEEACTHKWKIVKAPLTVKVSDGGFIYYGDEVSADTVYKMSSDTETYPDKEKGVDVLYITSEHPEGSKTDLLGDDKASDKINSDGITIISRDGKKKYNQYDPADTTGEEYTVGIDELTASNYEIKYEDGPLYVYPKTIGLEWEDEEGNAIKTPDEADWPKYEYNGKYQGVTATVTGTVNGDTVDAAYSGDDDEDKKPGNKEIDSNAKTGDPGHYTATVVDLLGSDGVTTGNYTLLKDAKKSTEETIAWTSQSYKIDQCPAELKWFNEEGKEITSDSDAKYIYDGEKHEVTAEVVNQKTRDDTKEKDKVKVVKYAGNGAVDSNDEAGTSFFTAAAESLDDMNYKLSGAAGDSRYYWVDPRPATFKWKYGSTVYNGKEQKNAAIVTNLVKTDDPEIVYGGEYAKRDVGSYTAEVKGFNTEKEGGKNYVVADNEATANGKWEITKATVAVKANNNEISYGDDPKDAGYAVSGLKGGDKINIRTVSYTYDYKKYGKPGYYKINPVVDAEANPNYDFVYEYGVLTVKDKVTTLKAKAKAKTTAGKISWNKVAGAKKYQVFIAQCNTKTQKFKIKKVKTVKAPLKSCTVRKLKRNTFYKFYVVALDGSGKKIAQTKTNHFCTGNSCGNLTNPKTIKASKHSVSVKAGGKYKLSAKVTKVRSDKKLATAKNHTNKVRYISEVPKVAKVDKNGKITGVSAGWCRIYVVGVNGIWDTIEVNVK